MAALTLYLPCAMIGDGSKQSPRRPGFWQRVDVLCGLINDGLICAKPDGTMDVGLVEQIELQDSLTYDFGVVGVRNLTMTVPFWKTIRDWEDALIGYPTVAGRDYDELKKNALGKMDWIKAKIVQHAPPAVQLPVAENDYEAVRLVLAKTWPVEVRPLARYYADMLDPAVFSLTDLPSFLRKQAGSEAVDPTKFATVMSRIDAADDTNAFKFLNNLYELAYLDVMVRNL
jgi:hypothetical protein